MSPRWLTRPPGGGRLSPPHGRVWHEPRPALLRCAVPPRYGTTARAHHPCPSVHMAPAQPASAHSATSMVARCGEGDLVGGWHAGASPSAPLSRFVAKGWSRSRPFAGAYTPFCRSQATLSARSAEDQLRGRCRVRLRDLLLRHRSRDDLDYKPAKKAGSSPPAPALALCRALLRGAVCPRHAPVRVARISRLVPACARREQAQHACCPSSTRGFILLRLRCAERLEPSVWARGRACR